MLFFASAVFEIINFNCALPLFGGAKVGAGKSSGSSSEPMMTVAAESRRCAGMRGFNTCEIETSYGRAVDHLLGYSKDRALIFFGPFKELLR